MSDDLKSSPFMRNKRVIIGVCLVLVLGKALEEFLRVYLKDHNRLHGGDQVLVFWVNVAAFFSPVLAPFIHLKIFLLNDLFPKGEEWVFKHVGKWLMTPSQRFESYPVSPPTDYSDLRHWSMLPGQRNTAKAVPPDTSSCHDHDLCDAVDVFYLHPTTWYSSASWNAPALHPVTAYLSDDAIGPQQANVFNVAGRIFAPRYRQMSAAVFLQDEGLKHEDASKALQIAYSDVRAAFQYFLTHHWDRERGIIIAGHSQGSLLGEMLLHEFFEDSDLAEKLVAAYLPGWTIFSKRYGAKGTGKLSICHERDAIGCVVSWRTFAVGGDPEAFLHVHPEEEDDKPVCVNPLTWKTDESYAGKELNKGGLDLMHPWTMWNYITGVTESMLRVDLPAVTPNISDAQCIDGHLFINPPSRFGHGWSLWPAWHFATFPGLNYHPYDYNFFFANVRENVVERVNKFLNRNN